MSRVSYWKVPKNHVLTSSFERQEIIWSMTNALSFAIQFKFDVIVEIRTNAIIQRKNFYHDSSSEEMQSVVHTKV
jgi:hypothetical protein